MFQLYDRTRRRICIAAFFALCIVPTLLVLALGVGRHLPGYARGEADRLSRHLGQTVSLDAVRHLRPGVVLYEGLDLSDPETGRSVLRCRALETSWSKSTDREGCAKTALVLIASQPEIEAAELEHVWQLLQRALTRQLGSAESNVQLTAAELTLRGGEASQTLIEVQGTLETLPAATVAEFGFRLAGASTSRPARIRIGRNRQVDPPMTGFDVDTGGDALPCSLLAPGLAGLEQLGSRSRFRGSIWSTETPQGHRCEVIGEFTDVDLGGLVTDHFTHTLSGPANVTLQVARFQQGRLVEAAGTLQAGPGRIGRSLLDAAATRLKLAPGTLPEPGDPIPYDRLACEFFVDSDGLWLRGQGSGDSSGAILTGRYGPLLGNPASQPQPVVALLGMLVPGSEVQVPATRQTAWLMRHLPD